MNTTARVTLFLTRIALGWLFFYAGITKILDSEWPGAADYISDPAMLPTLFEWLSQPEIIEWVNTAVQWGLTLIGISLIIGLFVRISSLFGALLMILMWLPIFNFPYAGAHNLIVNNHVIYALILLFFAAQGAGKYFGVDKAVEELRK